MFFFVNTCYSPDSADRASKTAGTFETLVAGHFPLHSGFFLGLVDTHTHRHTERKTDSGFIAELFQSFIHKDPICSQNTFNDQHLAIGCCRDFACQVCQCKAEMWCFLRHQM